MGITVSDIEQKEFQFKGAGYDPYDVDSYLDQICDEMIAMQDRIDALEAELKQAKAAVEAAAESVKPMPQEVVRVEDRQPVAKASETLENILLSAQRISDEAVETAKKRAGEIVAEAENKASELMDTAQEEKLTLEKELVSLRGAAIDYRKRFLSLINEHKSLLEADNAVFEEEGETDAEGGGEEAEAEVEAETEPTPKATKAKK